MSLTIDEMKNLFSEIPQVREAIQQKAAENENEALRQRLAMLDDLAAADEQAMLIESELEQADIQLEKARTVYEEKKQAVFVVGQKLSDARSRVRGIQKRLHRAGDMHQVHASQVLHGLIESIGYKITAAQHQIESAPSNPLARLLSGVKGGALQDAQFRLDGYIKTRDELIVIARTIADLRMARISPREMETVLGGLVSDAYRVVDG